MRVGSPALFSLPGFSPTCPAWERERVAREASVRWPAPAIYIYAQCPTCAGWLQPPPALDVPLSCLASRFPVLPERKIESCLKSIGDMAGVYCACFTKAVLWHTWPGLAACWGESCWRYVAHILSALAHFPDFDLLWGNSNMSSYPRVFIFVDLYELSPWQKRK